MGMSNIILSNIDQYWDKAEAVIEECESVQDFEHHMKQYTYLLQGTSDEEYVENGGLHQVWNDFWSGKI